MNMIQSVVSLPHRKLKNIQCNVRLLFNVSCQENNLLYQLPEEERLT